MSPEQLEIFQDAKSIREVITSEPTEEQTMSRSKKKNYNQEYYSKNRNELLEKARKRYKTKTGSGENILPLFPDLENGESRGRPTFRKRQLRLPDWQFCLLSVLTALMTYFLISESTKFYLAAEGGLIESCLKALIIEGAAVVFSVIKSRTWGLNVVYKLLVATIYGYSVWAVSSSVLHSAIHSEREYVTQQKTIQELEGEISKVEEIRRRFWDLNRVTLAGKYDPMLRDLHGRLDEVRGQGLKLPDQTVVRNTLAALVTFRILVMFSNFFCLGLLSRKYRAWKRAG